MACEDTARLANFYAGQTYEVEIEITDPAVVITGRTYVLTIKKATTLTDAQATGSNGLQVQATATADDNAARIVVLTAGAALTKLLDGDYMADVWELTPGPPAIQIPIIPLQAIKVSIPGYKGPA